MTPISPSWPPGPTDPQLRAGTIHVWHAALATVDDSVRELLNEQERARAAGIVRPCGGLLWERGRGVLRELLGRYLDLDGARLGFSEGPHGKPALNPPSGDEPRPDGGLSFNMSHSGESTLYAFALGVDVGVDIEQDRASTDVLALARRMLGRDEAERLEVLAPADRRRAFLSSWVRYEAKVKCLGLGIGAGPGSEKHASVPWVQELDLGTAAAAAISAAEQPGDLALWSWKAN